MLNAQRVRARRIGLRQVVRLMQGGCEALGANAPRQHLRGGLAVAVDAAAHDHVALRDAHAACPISTG